METIFKRDEKNSSITPTPDGLINKQKNIKSSLELILNDFKKQISTTENPGAHFCIFNEILMLTYEKSNVLNEYLNNNIICVFKFDQNLFNKINQNPILKFLDENSMKYQFEKFAILCAHSIFKIDNIEFKINQETKREFYELSFSFVSDGSKPFDYLCYSNHSKIDLPYNNLNVEDIKSLSNALKINPKISMLNLHGNKLTPENCKIIADGIKYAESLKLLSLSNCNIDTVGIDYISEGLKKNKSLQIIWLSNNKIGSTGLRGLMEMLEKNEKIEGIWLDSNSITYEGGYYISDMLLKNKSLKTIYLRQNELGPQGTQSISESLKQNKTLESIHLSKNNFGVIGAKFLSLALKQNNVVKEISINGNKIEKSGADCIADLLDCNKKIFVGKVDY